MLPDYPFIKEKIRKKLDEEIRKEIRKDPFLSHIRTQCVNEGNILTSTSVNGFSESVELKPILAGGFEITEEEIIDKGPIALFSRIPEIARKIIDGRSRLLFEKMEEVTSRTGNIVDAKFQPLSPKIVLDALEKVEIDFDEYGNPLFPILVLSKDQYEKIKNEITKWEPDPELLRKHRELIETKRLEWIDRENSRKLVD